MTGRMTVCPPEPPHRCQPGDDYEGFFDQGGVTYTYTGAGAVWECECGQFWRSIEAPRTGMGRPNAWVRCTAGRARRMRRRADRAAR